MRYKIGDTVSIKVSHTAHEAVKGEVVQIVEAYPFYDVYSVTPLNDLQVVWYFNEDELE